MFGGFNISSYICGVKQSMVMYSSRDIIEFIIVIVGEFAKRHGMSDTLAFRYLDKYAAISYLKNNYGIAHTLPFNDVVDSLSIYCKTRGGNV